jgi:pyruvate dehydrogenase E1 component alpha subunit
MSTPVAVALSVEDVAKRAAAYNMPGVVVDGNDILAVYEATRQAVERAREGQGPTLVEGKTYRWKGHSKSDQERYRTKEEVEAWKRQCPIARFQALLVQRGVIDEAQGEAMEREAYGLIEEAVAFAEASPEPKVEAITEGVYAP